MGGGGKTKVFDKKDFYRSARQRATAWENAVIFVACQFCAVRHINIIVSYLKFNYV